MVGGDLRLGSGESEDRADRLTSLDAFRGVVMLLLIPNVHGGFSLYPPARQHPEHTVWASLARLFTHVQWNGCSIWDLILPAFLFMVGVSIPSSYAARKRRGDSEAEIMGHAVLRAVALLMLGAFLQVPVQTRLDFLWPALLLALGLPLPEKLAGLLPGNRANAAPVLRGLWWAAIAQENRIAAHHRPRRTGAAFARFPGRRPASFSGSGSPSASSSAGHRKSRRVCTGTCRKAPSINSATALSTAWPMISASESPRRLRAAYEEGIDTPTMN